jgi:hypothetical protein
VCLTKSRQIWDLRTGAIHDAYAYDSPITGMMFDNRRIVSAAGEDVVKVYDKLEGRHWDCGSGVTAEEESRTPAIVERVRIKDGYGSRFRSPDLFSLLRYAFKAYTREILFQPSPLLSLGNTNACSRYLTEGRRDGKVGIWTS